MNYDHLITPGKKYRFININPGFAGSFGHHGNMNLRIKEQVLKDGGDFLVLANQKLEVQFHQPYNAVPTFSEITGKLVYHGDDSDYYRNFRKEITDKINWIHQLDTDTVNIYFMYMGDVKYIPLLLDIAGEVDRRTNRFLLNLFYSYNDYFPDGEPAPGNGSESDLILEATEKAAEDRNLFFTTDADVLCSRVAENFQNKDNICLIPSFVSIFKDRETIPAPPGKKEDHRVVVCVPSTSEDRGYHQVGNLIRLLKQEGKLHLFRFVIRNQSPHLSYIKDTSQRLINDAEIIEGNIDNEAYRQLISSSDLILLPYRKASFYARTSGVYADAVLAEKPVLATMETWIGRCVSKYRNGESFTDNDTDDLYRALLRLSADYKDKRDIYREARKEWLKDHNVANFVDTIKKAARLSDSGKPGKHTGKEPGKNNIVGGDELFDSHIVKLVDLIRQKNCLIGSNARDKDSVGQLKTSIKQLEDGLDEHRGIIRNLEQKVANREKTNKLLTQKIGERQNDIDKFREQIANRDRGLEVLRGNLAKRTEALEQNRDKAVREHKADITALRSKLSTRTEALEASRSQTANRDAALKTLRGKLDDRVEALRQSRLQVGNRNKAIEEFRSTIDTQNSSLYDINSSLRERETTIEKLDDQILHKNNELSKLIASLEKTENELESVYHSRTWRLSRFLVKIYHLLFGWVPRRKKK